MNKHVPSRDIVFSRNFRSFRTPAVHPSSSDAILLGMPHLSSNGLSEIWLLKDLGHRHWLLLAAAAGMAVPAFRDEAGNSVYAAFCAISIEDGDFAAVGENDTLRITSSLARLSRTQVSSRHQLVVDGRAIGTVIMISTFIRRATDGGNHTVARVAVAGLPAALDSAPGQELAGLAAAFRGGRVSRHRDFDFRQDAEIASFTFDPCPGLDFNGAGFLYFASFVAMVDRADWLFDPVTAMSAATAHREVFFYGNVDRGETVTVRLFARRAEVAGVVNYWRLERGSDGVAIADIFTRKSYSGTEP
ncbi:MAG: hypothetical protein P4M00_12245 [Azospirillaceae bacterium]|nr:hypothetical protein [Azospirillaceae bacterium]